MVERIIPRRILPWWQGVLLAVGITACAWLIRCGLQPVLGDEMPYTMFFIAGLIASALGGWKAGITATLLSGLAANFTFVAAGQGLILRDARGWGLALFIVVSLMLVALVHGLAAALRRETALREELATVGREYRHRIKNLLAVSQSLVDQSARAATSVEALRAKAVNQLHALGRAQDLLDVDKAHAARLHTLVAEILKPYDVTDRLTRPVAGPDVLVPADTTIAIALLLNELATNATKYGALSVAGGRLEIGWAVRDGWTVIEWQESGGPPVGARARSGFGTRLMKSALRASRGSADVVFHADGVRCVIKFPAMLQAKTLRAPRPARGRPTRGEGLALQAMEPAPAPGARSACDLDLA